MQRHSLITSCGQTSTSQITAPPNPHLLPFIAEHHVARYSALWLAEVTCLLASPPNTLCTPSLSTVGDQGEKQRPWCSVNTVQQQLQH